MRFFIFILSVLLLISACGQSGSLFLPEKESAGDNVHSDFLFYHAKRQANNG